MDPRKITTTLLMALILGAVSASAQTRLLRYPDLHGDQVVFCFAGDLWLASEQGGTARRLTTHPGQELFPKFSPDGRWVAFTGQYDGDEQVYIQPTSGGAPRQLTFYPARGPLPPRWGSDNQVYGWSQDGTAVLFRSMREAWDLTDTRLYTVSVTGGLPQALPMPVSGAGDFSPDGKKVVYSPLVRDFRSWKRYQGGWAQDLFVFDLQSHAVEPVAHHPRTERDPMWIGNKIYFVSDRTGTLNLFSWDLASQQVSQHTSSQRWDVRWASRGDQGRIVYEFHGELQVFDSSSGSSTAITIEVPNDGVAMRPSRVSAAGNIEDYSLSPKGERALFVARGDVFTAPIEEGPTRNLTQSSSAHDKGARWSPDGSKVAFLSDRSGEEEIYLIDQDGTGEPEALTSGGAAMRYAPEWSPDGEHLAFSDKEGRLYLLEVESRSIREIADEQGGQLQDFSWSPKGGYLAFTLSDDNDFGSLHLWDVTESKLHRVTDEYFNEGSPCWDPDGDYLFYLSDREFAPQIGAFEWNYVVNRETGIFALALRKDVAHPFPAKSDEVSVEDKKDEKEGEGEDGEEDDGDAESAEEEDEEEDPPYITIDFEGLGQRVVRVPVAADNYGGLSAVEGHLFYFKSAPFYYGRSGGSTELRVFSLEDQEDTVFAEAVRGYALSADHKKILVRSGGGFQLHDAKPSGKGSGKKVSTSGLMVNRVPVAEWRQIFHEVWRRFRDFFYAPNMHGYDWVSLREQYEPLLEHVAHRSDLNYVISEMIGELNVSHAYIAGGDYELPDRPAVALAGCQFELDEDAGRYRIAQILPGQNEESRYRSPLTQVGVDANEGDYLLAVDGQELTATDNPYEVLRHRASRPVEFTLNDKADFEGSREVLFDPITSERDLRYLNWVGRNRDKVAEATQGRVGYLHIPDMGAAGIREFIKWYYSQVRKEGLVIDVRGNGGGNVSQMLIERLRRTLLGVDFARTIDRVDTYPAVVFHGSLVCLLNENSASDGDIFPWMFKECGLGPLIGKRSWGGVIGITNRGTLLDGGTVFVPEFGNAAADGSWAVEGYGVDPDIVVENDPKAVLEGRDPQLERGIEEVMKAIRQSPRKLPGRPADPVKVR